jgi:hypothetical protein
MGSSRLLLFALCSLLGRSSSCVGGASSPCLSEEEKRRGEEKRRALVRVAAGVLLLVFPAGLFRREYFLVYLYRHACTREQCGITSLLIASNHAVIFFTRGSIKWRGRVAAPNRRRNGTASWRRAFLLGARARRAPRGRFRSLGVGAAVVAARERNNVSLTGHGRHEKHADGFAGRQRQVRTSDALVVSRRKFATRRAALFARLSSVEQKWWRQIQISHVAK